MSVAPCKQQEVSSLVDDLIITKDEPERFVETLDTMFDAWLVSDGAGELTNMERSQRLFHYRQLQELLRCLDR